MRQRSHRPADRRPSWLLEQLEPRALLSDTPFPALSDLENPADTVVRVETSLGDIDVELFNAAAPLGVASFLARITRGDFDPSFFSRLTPGRTLETGAFKLDEDAGVFEIPEPGLIPLEGGRPDVERTIALERTGSGLASGVRFVVNLGDNSGSEDAGSVVGRIANDASWAIVQRIAHLHTADFDVELTGAPGHRFDFVPVMNVDDADGGQGSDDDHDFRHRRHRGCDGEQTIVEVVNVEVVKAAGESRYYTNLVMYSEGFSGSTVDEFVPIENTGDAPAAYQVILRFEKDPNNPFGRRDAVIARGTIGAHARGGLDVWHGNTDFPGLPDALITPGRPYAIELRSTAMLAATLSHYDFGTATGEDFTSHAMTNWVIAGGAKGANFDFLVWHNATARDATVVVTFIPEGGAALTPIVVTTKAYRRGGIDVSHVEALPAGRFAVRITSDQPIVAALSHYLPGAAPEGSSSLGAGGRPTTVGVIPLASFGATEDDTVTLSFLAEGQDDEDGCVSICHIPPGNPGNAHTIRVPISAIRAHLAHGDHLGACDRDDDPPGGGCGDNTGDDPPTLIDFTIDFENPDLADITLPHALTLQAGESGSVRLDSSVLDIAQYLGQRFSVRWTASRPVFGGMSEKDAFDGVSTAVAVTAATEQCFGEGFMDPARAGREVFETVAVYNPYATPTDVRLNVRYADGFTLAIDRTAVAHATLYIDLHRLEEVLSQGWDHQRYFYSLEVVADQPVAAQLSHLDTNLGRAGNAAGGFTTFGTTMGDLTMLDSVHDQ